MFILLNGQGNWGMKNSSNWLCYVIAKYKLSLDNFNTKIMGYTEFICLYYKVLPLDHSELYGSFRAVAKEAVRNHVVCFVTSWGCFPVEFLTHLLILLP